MSFPNLWQYQQMLAIRDQGMMLVIALVTIAAGTLIESRFLFQRWLPAIRATLVAMFYISLFVVLAVMLLWK